MTEPLPPCTVHAGSVAMGGGHPLAIIAGPCVVESAQVVFEIAEQLVDITGELGIPLIFKASFDKANRSSHKSFRGLGLEKGLEILAHVKDTLNVPVLTDVHEVDQVDRVAEVADVLQIPAYLVRQTDLVLACGRTGRVVNAKKGQFLAPWDMKNVIEKIRATGNPNITLTERGASFGYNNLVVDMKSLPIMRDFGFPVVFDATHSVQLPGGMGTRSGGQREYVPALARAAVAVGVDALFMETHLNPDEALSDGPNMIALKDMKPLLRQLKELDDWVKSTVLSPVGE